MKKKKRAFLPFVTFLNYGQSFLPSRFCCQKLALFLEDLELDSAPAHMSQIPTCALLHLLDSAVRQGDTAGVWAQGEAVHGLFEPAGLALWAVRLQVAGLSVAFTQRCPFSAIWDES